MVGSAEVRSRLKAEIETLTDDQIEYVLRRIRDESDLKQLAAIDALGALAANQPLGPER